MADKDWADHIFSSFAAEFREDVEYNLGTRSHAWRECGSPIERVFAISFALVTGYMHGKPLLSDGYSMSGESPQVFMTPQFASGPYRVDFLIGWNIGEHRHTSIVVECDGHDFHEKTKAQAARDKARDRYLSGEFARVLRFTGSEIYKNPVGCALEAQGLSEQVFWAWHDRGNGR